MAQVRIEAFVRDGWFISEPDRDMILTGQIRIYLLENGRDGTFRFWEKHFDWSVA